jgi:hypothetical protein
MFEKRVIFATPLYVVVSINWRFLVRQHWVNCMVGMLQNHCQVQRCIVCDVWIVIARTITALEWQNHKQRAMVNAN